MPTIEERVAVLEAQAAARDEVDRRILERLDKVDQKLGSQGELFQRYHGFVGGVLFVVGALWTFGVQFKDWFFNHGK